MTTYSAQDAYSRFSDEESTPDTDPNSAFWRNSPAIFFSNDTFGKRVYGLETEVRSRWTTENLYLLFSCAYDNLNLKPYPQTEVETNELWNWDVAEVFLGSDFGRIHLYKEVEISPQSEWVDVDVDLRQPNHENGWVWDCECEVAARIVENTRTWYAFMRIPLVAISPGAVAVGSIFRANFCRIQGLNRTLIAWQPTMANTFHVPEAFGRLVLE